MASNEIEQTAVASTGTANLDEDHDGGGGENVEDDGVDDDGGEDDKNDSANDDGDGGWDEDERDWDVQSSTAAATAAEIVAISERVRNAMECPICLMLIMEPTCRCPNGHVICYSCLNKLRSMENAERCPMCRSPMALGPHVSCTAAKLTEITAWLKVACTYRPYGCEALVPLIAVADHESSCVYMLDVQCLVSTCQWEGLLDGLFDHVSRMHPASAVRSEKNYLDIGDVRDIVLNRRRSYLVETPAGLFWVVSFVEKRCRIRTSVFMVYNKNSSEDYLLSRGPQAMVFRVMWTAADGKTKTRSRIRRVIWSPCRLYEKITETYTFVRCRSGRLQISWYNRLPPSRRCQILVAQCDAPQET